jgi:probable phosphoglycerate mutase
MVEQHMESTHLYLIRHGESFSNADQHAPLAGIRGDLGLTPRGKLQAERLRDRLTATGEIKANVLIASTLPRARQTAETIAPALNLPIIWDDEVQEMRVGDFDGMPWSEIKERVPDFRRDPFHPFAPGGENWPQFVLRVGTALDRIAHEHTGKTTVIVCHGGVIDASLVVFFRLSSLRLPPVEFHTHNTSITHWERRDEPAPGGQMGGEWPRWRLLAYNDDLHIRDLDAVERIQWPRLKAEPEGGLERLSVPLPTEEE